MPLLFLFGNFFSLPYLYYRYQCSLFSSLRSLLVKPHEKKVEHFSFDSSVLKTVLCVVLNLCPFSVCACVCVCVWYFMLVSLKCVCKLYTCICMIECFVLQVCLYCPSKNCHKPGVPHKRIMHYAHTFFSCILTTSA